MNEPVDLNSGIGWYEWHKPPQMTTHIAYVHEDGGVYDPEQGWDPPEWPLAAAMGHIHRLVRADEIALPLEGGAA